MVVLLLRYIFGFLRIRIDGEYPERFINLCKINGINLWNIIRIDDSIYANIEAKKFLHLRKFRKKSRVKIKIIKKTGAYFLIRPYLKRKGIAVGVIIFFLLNVFLSQFIWNIEINGNKTIDNNTIIDNCRSIGIYEGILSKNIDTNDARLKLIMENNDISWASFIIEGSHLTVNILETEKTEKSDKTPGNLIASNDGIIEYIEISKGKPLVKRDQVVVKGQILSTGAIEYSDGTTHFVKSTGKVYAKTEKTLDVNIDYYVKINFKGVVNLVDTLGGVTVDVPKDLCTDDSNRVGKVCIKKGVNKLNGEEALVLARNRYNLARGDLDRGNNQQLLLKGLLNEVTNISSVTQITDILSTISNNLDTNMTTNQILSLYNILKDIISAGRNNGKDIIAIQKLELVGDGKTLYDNYSKLNLWNYVLRDESIEEVSQAMQDNLGNSKLIKTFEYSINEKYIQKSIGK